MTGLFDKDLHLEKLDKYQKPLSKLNQIIDWEMFRPIIETAFEKDKKSNAGRKPYDRILNTG
jgi:transposase, IS5 family